MPTPQTDSFVVTSSPGLPFLSFAPPAYQWIGLALHPLAITGSMAAVAIAIFRYRLYDINVIVNRTLVYGALSGALALVHLLSVLVLQSLVRTLTGQQSQLAVVASTLLVAALFHPLRRRIQGFIDRLFYRRKYEASQLLARFGSTLRDEVGTEELIGNLLGIIEHSVQPKHVSLWVRSRQPSSRGHLELEPNHESAA